MDLKIVSQKENPFLERKEIVFEASSDNGTPSRTEVKNKLVALTNSAPDKVLVQAVTNRFGSKTFTGHAFVYKSNEKLRLTHRFYSLKRDKLASEEEIKKHADAKAAKKQKTEKK